jgi:DNA-binding response OmpR family regulator
MNYTALGPILIVEGDRKTVALLSLYFRGEGFKTIVAHDGQQALELAPQWQPSFVVLDLLLPRLDGWEVCRQLRRTSDVPIRPRQRIKCFLPPVTEPSSGRAWGR